MKVGGSGGGGQGSTDKCETRPQKSIRSIERYEMIAAQSLPSRKICKRNRKRKIKGQGGVRLASGCGSCDSKAELAWLAWILDCGVLGTCSEHAPITSMGPARFTFCIFELWAWKLPHPRFEKRLIDCHDDHQSCAFRSRAGKPVMILTPQLYSTCFSVVLPLCAKTIWGANLFSQKLLHKYRYPDQRSTLR